MTACCFLFKKLCNCYKIQIISLIERSVVASFNEDTRHLSLPFADDGPSAPHGGSDSSADPEYQEDCMEWLARKGGPILRVSLRLLSNLHSGGRGKGVAAKESIRRLFENQDSVFAVIARHNEVVSFYYNLILRCDDDSK